MLVLVLLLAPIGNITFSLRQPDTIEASLEYLLGNLETWGSWLDPANETGLLPEADGRFMIPNAPILQTGGTTLTGNIGIMGFAQPIIINENEMPQGFSENERLYEPFPINYNDSIEDVFHKVPYFDRFAYQYGIQVNGRIIQVYRKPIEKESRLLTTLQTMGAPPEIAEAWVKEYIKIAHLPQTLQLAWLIAGNPLAEDYQSHIESMLETIDFNTLSSTQSGQFPLPKRPEAGWINQDPFWDEIQDQPFLKAFSNLLSGASEEIQRSFIVTLFFLEPILPIVQVSTKPPNNTGDNSVPTKSVLKNEIEIDSGGTLLPSGHLESTTGGNMKVSVYIATSLDGFIARENGDLDWLPGSDGQESNEDNGFQEFLDSVDALVMGRNTYDMVMSFGQWPYGNKKVIVLTSRPIEIPNELSETVQSQSISPTELVKQLSEQGIKHIYVDGGGTIQSFLKAGLVQQITVTRIPVLIGSGIPLFGILDKDKNLKHIETQSFSNGFVQSRYEVLD